MKVLIAPMAAITETSGPFSRARALAIRLQEKGYTPAFCAAQEMNYQRVEGVPNYFAPVPSPMGLPVALGKRAFGVAQRLGLQQRRRVKSFEEVLFIVGAIQKKFFAQDVCAIRSAIHEFRPDVVYAEFRPAAIVAAKMEDLPVVTGYSYPARKAYACSPQYAHGVNGFLQEHGLPNVESVLDIFEWADLKIVPSCFALEPLDDPKVVFTGPFTTFTPQVNSAGQQKNVIVVYMGNGSITYPKQLSVLKAAFQGSEHQIYIASYQATPADEDNIHVDKRFDFKALLPQAIAFLNHGGQNSILTGIMLGVPQMVFPGNVFERQYNADSLEKLALGRRYLDTEFNPVVIRKAVEEMRCLAGFDDKVREIQCQLLKLGGVDRAIESICSLVGG